MTKALNTMLAVLGCWLTLSPLLFGYDWLPDLAVTSTLGLIVFIVALIAVLQKEYKAGLNYLLLVLGIVSILVGIVALVLGWGVGTNGIITGALVSTIAFVTTRFTPAYEGATFYDRGGATMVDLKSIRIKDGDLLMKAMLLQSMPSTIYVRPDEIWKVITMLPAEVIFAIPKLLITGYRLCRQGEKTATTPEIDVNSHDYRSRSRT
jgi:hypothetical protein